MPATHTDAIEETFTEDCESTAALRYEKVRTARRRLAEGRYDRNDWLRSRHRSDAQRRGTVKRQLRTMGIETLASVSGETTNMCTHEGTAARTRILIVDDHYYHAERALRIAEPAAVLERRRCGRQRTAGSGRSPARNPSTWPSSISHWARWTASS